MHETTFTELRNQAKHYFDLVERGEVVRVFRNGRAVAEIHPVAPDVPSWKRRIARPIGIRGGTLSELILDERGA